MNKVTVLESIYAKDKAEYFDKTLESLYNQTLQAETIVLVKDGPITAELENVINRWKAKLPLLVVGYEKNQGLAHALNYGMQFVKTDLIARMDSDDCCLPTRFEKQVHFFTENDSCQICGTALNEFYIDKNGEEFIRKRIYPHKTASTSTALFKGTPIGHPSVMMRTSLLQRYKYNEYTSMNEDIDLWFRLIHDGIQIFNLSESLINFRITDGTFRRRSFNKAFNEYLIYTKNLIKLFGVNIMLIFPLFRFFSRLLPCFLTKKLYFSNTRTKYFNVEKQ